ncbi:MAG: DUF2062 domain-containing protein [Verrucomicrobiaceae bacterium]
MSEELGHQRESLWKRWVLKPVMTQVTQGTEPRQIAKAAAVGVTLGVFPLLGTTFIMTMLVGLPMKLNQVVLNLSRELVYPVHLATVLLFMKAGEWLFNVPPTQLSISLLIERFQAWPGKFFADFGMLAIYGVSVWALIAPVLFALVYLITWQLTERASQRFARSRHAA